MKKGWILSYQLNAQRRLLSDWADAQADPSLRCALSHFVGFVIRRLKLPMVNILKFRIPKKKNTLNLFSILTINFAKGGNLIASLCNIGYFPQRIFVIFLFEIKIFLYESLEYLPYSPFVMMKLLLLFVQVLRRFQQFFSRISTVSCCDRELNAHFYSAESLKYHAPDT